MTNIQEIWKDIPGLNYQASSLGNIRHSKRKIILSGNIDRYGYRYHCINMGGKDKSIKAHRLVARAFIGLSDLQIDHINNNKLDNRPDNLQYCLASFNCQKRSKTKFNNITNINWHKGHKKFQVRITVNGERIRVGEFTTEIEAVLALKQA
jgi:hypothetical protein